MTVNGDPMAMVAPDAAPDVPVYFAYFQPPVRSEPFVLDAGDTTLVLETQSPGRGAG